LKNFKKNQLIFLSILFLTIFLFTAVGNAESQISASEWLAKGNQSLEEQDYVNAIADYTKAIELNPLNANAYINRGNSYSHKGLYDLAITDFNKAIELNPQDANTYANRAICHYQMGKRTAAKEDLELFLKYASPDDKRVEMVKKRLLEL